MAGERDMSRMMRQLIHKKQERSQAIQEGEPRIFDLVEGVPEFRNVRDRGLVQYVRYRDDIFSINMVKEGKTENKYPKASTLVNGGWDKLPSGLILQWGTVTADSTVYFPIAFPDACFIVTFGKITSDSSIPRATAIARASFNYSSSDVADGDSYWLALGI